MASDPLFEAQVDRIQRLLKALDERFTEFETELADQHASKEELLQEQWRNRREMTTLRHMKNEYDRLAESEKAHEEREAELEAHLADLQRLIKAFRGAVRPS